MLLALFVMTIVTQAQEMGHVFGKITDPKGKAIPNATVVLNNEEQTPTSENGNFDFGSTVVFPISISVHATGYKNLKMAYDRISWNTDSGMVLVLHPESKVLDEVLITVRRNNSYLTNELEMGGKYSGKLKDLPQSVAVVSREFMEDKQAYTTREVVQDLAGVTTASSYDDLVIRGFKSGYETGIRLVNGLRSGYSYGNSYYRSPLTLNLESIAVLKGPGASLFGDVIPGGTINMVTKKPLEFQKTTVNFSGGSFGTLRTSIDMGGPLDKDKKVLYRLNAGYEYSQTFRDVNQQQNFMFAPSLTFKPVEGTQVDVDIVYDQFHGFLDRGMGIKGNDFYALPRSFNFSQPSDFYNTQMMSFSGRLTQRLTRHLSLNLNYMKSMYQEDVNEHRTLNTFADAPTNTIMNLRFFDRHGKDYTDNAVAYFKWDIPGEKMAHHIVAGVDFAQYRGDKSNSLREARQQMVNGQAVPLTFDMNNPMHTIRDISNYSWRDNVSYPFLSPYKTTGIYVQDQVAVAERLKVILGLRHENYNSETIDGKNVSSATQNAWLPRVGLTYTLNDRINYFASYSQGFAPVGANFIENYKDYGAEKPFTSETSYQLETGFKTGFFKEQLQMDLSLFQIQRNNMLIATGETSDKGLPVYRQSGEAVSNGIELDVRGQLTKEFQLMANYSFNDTKVKASSIASEVGQKLPGAPKNMASLWMKYVFSTTGVKGLGFGTGMTYVDSRRMDNSVGKDTAGNALWAEWPSYITVNAAAYYHIGGMKLAVNVNNIFDKYYFLGGFDYTRAFPGAPRNVMLSLGYTF